MIGVEYGLKTRVLLFFSSEIETYLCSNILDWLPIRVMQCVDMLKVSPSLGVGVLVCPILRSRISPYLQLFYANLYSAKVLGSQKQDATL